MKSQSQVSDLTELRAIESKLKYSLRPVAPRPDFVQELQQQLFQQFQKLPALTKFSLSYFIWLALVLILTVLLLFALSMRILVFIVSMFSLLSKFFQQPK